MKMYAFMLGFAIKRWHTQFNQLHGSFIIDHEPDIQISVKDFHQSSMLGINSKVSWMLWEMTYMALWYHYMDSNVWNRC